MTKGQDKLGRLAGTCAGVGATIASRRGSGCEMLAAI